MNFQTGENEHWNWHWAETNNRHVQVDLVPGQGAIVTIDFSVSEKDDPDPTTTDSIDGIDWVEGELNILWEHPYWRESRLSDMAIQQILARARTTAEVGAHLAPPSPPPNPSQAVQQIERAVERNVGAREGQVKRAREFLFSLKGEEKPRGDSEEPARDLSPLMARFLGRVRHDHPQMYKRYENELLRLGESTDRQLEIRREPTECGGVARILVERANLRLTPVADRTAERFRWPVLRRVYSHSVPVVEESDVARERVKIGWGIACELFGRMADFPLKEQCVHWARVFDPKSVKQVNGMSRGSQHPSTKRDSSARLRPGERGCPAEPFGDSLCVKVGIGESLRIDRKSHYVMYISPDRFCQKVIPDDAIEIETAKGPVVGFATGKAGEFMIEALDPALDSLFGTQNSVRVIRQTDGRLATAAVR